VASAIGSGRAAAAQIVAALTGAEEERPEALPLAGPDMVAVASFPREPGRACAILPVEERCAGFAEVRRGLVGRAGDEDAVSGEAARCLACGSCNACGTCVSYCPEGILRCIEAHACDFDLEYCKGCGLCAALCPRGAIVMRVGSEAVAS
jgi:Pyruvate/2-oxoacid:ferredoxin oxidoreductase delta subunit